jgi:diguanylate cyclase (GGDEF)-like protein
MPYAWPLAFLLLQCTLMLAWPTLRGPAAYAVMVAAPVLCALATLWRAGREAAPARGGWWVLSAALLVWAAGALGNLWHELIQGRSNEMYLEVMLAFHLAPVPLTFLLASDWQSDGRGRLRLLDALMSLTLGCTYFLFTWSVLTVRGSPDDASVASMVWLVDAQNLFVTLGAAARWWAADDSAERSLFGAIASHSLVYLALASANNHFVAGDPRFGPEVGSMISIAFAWLAAWALQGRAAPLPHRPPAQRVRMVRSASPLLLALALLIVSLFLIRWHYAAGVVGILVAVGGYALRNILSDMAHRARDESLRRERSEWQTLAWTDALTGVANRRALDQALDQAGRRARREGRHLSALMLDIDHFKLLNDAQGHAAGDRCLQQVAAALRDALVRPDDLLARYGGEEFVALLQDTDGQGAAVVAERLRAAVEALQLPHPASPWACVTVSIGVADNVHGQGQVTALIAAADQALYVAKCAGRNRVAGLHLLAGNTHEAQAHP